MTVGTMAAGPIVNFSNLVAELGAIGTFETPVQLVRCHQLRLHRPGHREVRLGPTSSTSSAACPHSSQHLLNR